jgi:hypothetical protein
VRILVTGSRDWTDRDVVMNALIDEWEKMGHSRDIVLVHGAARGLDRMAAEIWEGFLGYRCEPHPAKWNLYGKAAGYIRNEEMVGLGANACLAFLMPCSQAGCNREDAHFSHGAEGCAALAVSAGIPVRRFEHEDLRG